MGVVKLSHTYRYNIFTFRVKKCYNSVSVQETHAPLPACSNSEQTMKQKSDFRRLHEQEGCFLIPNLWDVGTVLSLASLGYSALATTSVGLAFALGQHAGQVSQKATLAHCRDLVAAPPLASFGRS